MTTDSRRGERGHIFFYIFLMLALLGLLTFVVTRMGSGGNKITGSAQVTEQVSRLLSQTSMLSGALQQMVMNGADATTLATNLNLNTSGDGWDVAPHMYKLYHTYGGGVKPLSQTGTGSALSDDGNMANNFQIRKASYVKGVGATDVTSTPHYPDILFTAQVSSLAACRLINARLMGWPATANPPVVLTASSHFDNLFTNTDGTTNDTIDNTTCTTGSVSDCVNLPQACVQNSGGTQFGYYQVLHRG